MRHVSRSLLPFLTAALCCWAAGVRADTYTVVWSPEDLLRALALAAASPLDQSVIELPRDIVFRSSNADAYDLPLRISGRLTLRRAQEADSVFLSLTGISRLLFLERGAQLELSNLTVSDLSYSASDLNETATQAPALVLFPTVDAAPGATVKLHNVSLELPDGPRCNAYQAGQPIGGAAPVVDMADGVAVGDVAVETQGVSVTCLSIGGPASAIDECDAGMCDGGSGSATPGWVWAIVAVAAVAVIGGAVGGVLLWRRRRAAKAAAASPAVGSGLESRSSNGSEIDKKLSSGTVSIAVFTPRE